MGYIGIGDYIDMLEQGVYEFYFDSDFRNKGFRNFCRAVARCHCNVVVYLVGNSEHELLKILDEINSFSLNSSIPPEEFSQFIQYKLKF